MANYTTVICKVKGETILKLNNHIVNNENNHVFHNKDHKIIDKSQVFMNVNINNDTQYQYRIDSKGIKQEAQPIHDNQRYEEESGDSFHDNTNYKSKQKMNSNRSDGNERLESYKKYLLTTRIGGKQLHLCQFNQCTYESHWNNAIVNHIRSVHLNFRPFLCNFPNCGKRFAISCNLNNHKKVHTGRGTALKQIWSETRPKVASNRKVGNSSARNGWIVSNNDNIITGNNSHKHSVTSIQSDRKRVPNKYVMNRNTKKTVSTIRSQQRRISSLSSTLNSTLSPENDQTVAADSSKSSNVSNSIVSGVESLDKYVKITKKNGKMWRLCQIQNCSYGTNLAASIVHHIRTHLNDRPFKCHFANCGKAFTILTNLNNHKKTHKGRRSF